MIRWFIAVVVVIALGGPAGRLGADEGMWLPVALGGELSMAHLKERGLELSKAQIWADDGPCLTDAMLQIGSLAENGMTMSGYGSGAFVSSKGLILTNHHVAFDAIAALTTDDRNIIDDGYAAKTMADELQCEGLAVRFTTDIVDVSAIINGSTKDGMTLEQKDQALGAAIQKALIEASQGGKVDCEIKAAFNRERWYLYKYSLFKDIRLVYAPPRMIGEYGGDTDNWMWPRHTGDFSYLRAYVAPDGSHAPFSKDNIPFAAKTSLKVSIAGYKPDDFCFIMGYPGSTYRDRSSFSVQLWGDSTYPNQVKMFEARIEQMRAQIEANPSTRSQLASTLKSLQNGLKNSQGMVDGLKKLKVAQQIRDEEARWDKWIQENEGRKAAYGSVMSEIADLYAVLSKTNERRGILNQLVGSQGSPLLMHHYALHPDRFPQGLGGMLADMFKRTIGQEDLDGQRKVIAQSFKPLWDLSDEMTSPLIREARQATPNLEDWAALMIPERISDENIDELAAATPDTVDAITHPFVQMGLEIVGEFDVINAWYTRFGSRIAELRAAKNRGIAEWKGVGRYPDANLTLRLTYGKVAGYSPADAVHYRYYTTAAGALAKHTDADPFDVPDDMIAKVQSKDFGRYADKKTGSMFTCFLSDTDITGGNSGSPIMNGRGEMTGIAFDGNYEAMTSDFRFTPSLTRTINVDIRYVLWCTEKLAGMKRLVDEMVIVD